MSWEAWLTLAVVVAMIVVLALDLTDPAAVIFGAVLTLLVVGVLEPAEALSGFSNPAPITVAALYVVAAGVERTGVLNRLVDVTVGRPRGERITLARLVIPSAGASAVLNNTPVVAMVSPAIARWSRRAGRAASRLLMPLSFAAILGGMITVIGTSTNIVVSGLLVESDMEAFGFFEVAKLGLPLAVVGLVLIVAVAPAVLPQRRSTRDEAEDSREFTVEMTVVTGGAVDGMSVVEAGLRHLAGVFLVQVERGGGVVGAVSPEFILGGGDTLRFVGNADEVADLQERSGLELAAQSPGTIPSGRMVFFEAVIGAGSVLVGHSLRDVGFRNRHQAAVLAIHRADQRVLGKLGDVRLRVGDTLLVLASPGFRLRWRGSGDFLLISRLDSTEPARSGKIAPASLIGLAVVAAAATGLLPILEASLLGGFAMLAFGVLTPDEARQAVDLSVFVVIAGSFGVGAAIAKTGLAGRLADGLVGGLDGAGSPVVLVGVSLVTIALTEAVTNNAAAVLVFPIALAVAADIGADPRAFAAVVTLTASASFLTPIGYQTNTMVWGPGGYRFGDYARLGLPLTLATVAVVALVTPLWWSL
ncbi:MAG: SLC13 family permease [Acidimicrobiia bacterium]